MLKPVKEKTGKPRAKEHTAKEHDMERKEEAKRGVSPQRRMLYLWGKALGFRVCPERLQERRWSAQSRRTRATPRGRNEAMLHEELCSRNRRG